MKNNIFNEIEQLRRLAVGGTKEVCIAVLDGTADLSHPCLAGADLRRIDNMISEAPDASAMSDHATHVISTIFGQPRSDSEVQGWAPHCRGILIPIFSNRQGNHVPQLDLARAINQAIEHGANIINISGGEFVKDVNEADRMLKNAVKECARHDVLVVAAAGNDGCKCLHVPAALSSVLAVGAMDDSGKPMSFSNWGDEYSAQGILAPGQDLIGAKVGGGTLTLSGTSFATPLVTAVVGLLASIQHARGITPSPAKIREALITSALRCHPLGSSDCQKHLAGSLNIQGAFAHLFNGEKFMDQTIDQLDPDTPEEVTSSMDTPDDEFDLPDTAGDMETDMPDVVTAMPLSIAPSAATGKSGVASSAGGITASNACACQTAPNSLVYALGKIGYDFGTEACRDGFMQLMQSPDNKFPNPYDPKQLLDFLEKRPYETKMLIWTLNVDLTPIYAIEPREPFARDTYALLVGALHGQTSGDSDINYIERVSIPGYLTGKTVRLYSGQVVPVISAQPRGLFYWNVNELINTAATTMQAAAKEGYDDQGLKDALREFLNRIYYDYRNLGTASSERALNFAATNAFQAADVFANNLTDTRHGSIRQLANIEVEKSPFCRLDSDCWDVKLAFFDPENDRRAMKIVRFTIDVSAVMPVTLGEPKSWSATGF